MTVRSAPLVRGNALVNIRSFVQERHGALGLDRLCAALEPKTAMTLTLARWGEWYPAHTQSDVLVAYDRLFADATLASIPSIGAYQCSRDLASPLGWLFRLFAPARLTQHMDVVWRRFHSSGYWTSDTDGDFVLASLHEWSGGSLAACSVLHGYLAQLVKELARNPVELRHARCAFKGAAACEFRLGVPVDALGILSFADVETLDIPVIGRELVQLDSRKAITEAIISLLRSQAIGVDAVLSLPVGDDDQVLSVAATIGRPRPQYDHRWVLEGRGRIVGRIEVQLDRPERGDVRLRAINELVPWFAMALASVERVSADEAIAMTDRVRSAAQRWALTERQHEVLALVVQGRSNRQIALELECAEGTIEVHVKALFKKASVAGRTELTAKVAAVVPLRSHESA
ncbi:MAG: helix-turn-helix transcriptional regulator [Polyangiales bacterium]